MSKKMKSKAYDFSGWATRNDIECSDGRTIRKDAFKDNDGEKVPLVWNHNHDNPEEVLGHALLENRNEGVYAYCKFNNTESGRTARELVKNGDVDKLSIYANRLKTNANNVIHGCIREVSLVLAGANPGAYIDSVIVHSADGDEEEEATIYTDEPIEVIEHSEDEIPDEVVEVIDNNDDKPEEIQHAESSSSNETDGGGKMNAEETKKETSGEKTIQEIFDTLTDEQKDAVYAIVGMAVEEGQGETEEEKEDMKHNVFDKEEKADVLAHSEFVKDAIQDARRFGSMKDSFLAHAEESGLTWEEANDFTILFPDATNINREPQMVENDNSWVAKVMKGIKHSPFSRVKNTLGRMNEPEARAKGYIKGSKKANIQMSVLNRVTTPTTVYVKNDIDRDDVVDITDFNVVAWQKKEMRKQLDKDLARQILIGDGRDISDPYKINDQNIRPIITDDDMYTIKYTVTEGRDYNSANSHSENDSEYKGVIRGALKARKQYKGSGKPAFYTTEDLLTELLLIEDQNGRVIYEDEAKLARALRVSEIITVPEMETETGIYGIIVNLADYTAGADKGGNVNMFDDFDIDYNQMKYLMETRMSGALTQPYAAIVLKKAGSNNNEQVEG